MEGKKTGYASSKETAVSNLPGVAKRVESYTLIRTALLDTPLDIQIRSVTELSANGRPVTLNYVMESNGRSQTVIAFFGPDKINVRVENNGQFTTTSVQIPAGARLVDDATSVVEAGKIKPGQPLKVFVLDPVTLSLIENTVLALGESGVEVRGLYARADRYEIRNVAATTTLFLGKNGNLVKLEGPLNMVMLPETKEAAMDMSKATRADLAFGNALKPNKPINRVESTSSVSLKIEGVDLSSLPSDDYQKLTKINEKNWTLKVHPESALPAKRTQIEKSALPISKLATAQAAWLKPSLHIPSNESRFKDLAKQIVGGETNSYRAAQKINVFVQSQMTTDAGIGVLRNANEVLDSKSGVCRDYAILTATLMRAAGIPTRLVSGLIYDNGQYYYHAWVDAFTGTKWVPFDSTRANLAMNASRIKLNQGNVEQAFTFKVMTGAKIQVLEVQYQ